MREANEDRYLVAERRGTVLLAVADGVGGVAGGAAASAAAVDKLASAYFEGRDADPSARLAAAIRAANDWVLRASEEGGHDMAASTLVAAAIRRRSVAIGNLGDSRAYLVRGRSVRQITSDHSGERASSITRFVGDPRGVQPDVFVETLRSGDRLVLCSDGLTRHVPDAEIAATVVARPPDDAARALVDLANERGGEDNVTVLVYGAPGLLGYGARRAVASTLLLLVVLVAVAGTLAVALGYVPGAVPATPSPSPTASPTLTASPTPTRSP